MMNRNSAKHSFTGKGGRNLHSNGIHNAPVTGLSSSHRRAKSFTNTDDFSSNNRNNLDLFSRNRRTLSVASSDESDLQVRQGRPSGGSTKSAKSVFDDLLSSNEGEKHDYDWLLTPPGTHLLPSSGGKESQPKSIAPKRNSSVISGFTQRTSRLSVSQSENNQPSRRARSSSVTRPSISTTQNSNRNSSNLTTSSASVSSHIRPSTPTNHPPSAARPSTTSSRTTPSRTRPPSTDRTIRPSTPTRPASRPSTPTRRNIPTLSTSQSVGPTSSPKSPTSRVRAPVKPEPINPSDFSHKTPPNLRTSLPERAVSAGRSRPGTPMTVKGNVENLNTRRQLLPVVTRGRVAEPPDRGRLHVNGQVVESITKKPVKVLNSESGTGFGRSISKKSLDMAIKHMDIRKGGTRPLSGSTLFPQSIRSETRGMQPSNASRVTSNVNSKTGNYNKSYHENKVKPVTVEHKGPCSSKLMARVDACESLRYDAILMKEDLNNTKWLHTADEKSDQCPLFDNGFEPLPEPFAPL